MSEDYLNAVNDIVQGLNVVVDVSDYDLMMIDQHELRNLLNILFSTATLGKIDDDLIFSSEAIRLYLKTVYPNRYSKCIEKLKKPE